MQFDRLGNAKRNMVYGFLLVLLKMIFPFLIRTALLYWLGIEYLGLNGLFASILQILNLAELGVGSVMVYSMYKPIVDDDIGKVCALLKLYKYYYNIIGLVILFGGLCLLPFLPKLIAGTIPENIDLTILYLINLAITVLSYWMFAYKSSLFVAYQRNDVANKIDIFILVCQNLIQILCLYFVKNYYVFLMVALIMQAIKNCVIAYVANKLYSNIMPIGDITAEEKKTINCNIRDLFTAKLGTVFIAYGSGIIVSAYLGLKELAIYQNYYLIVSALIGIVGVIFSSCTAIVGNELIVDKNEYRYKTFRKIALFVLWVNVVVIGCFVCLCQPFMQWWVGENNMMDFEIVILFGLFAYLHNTQLLLCLYKDASGIWSSDKYRPFISGFLHIVISMSFIKEIGIYAVLFGMIASYIFIATPWLIYNLFKTVFMQNYRPFVIEFLKNSCVAGVIIFGCSCVCRLFVGVTLMDIIFKLLLCFVLINLCMFAYFNFFKEYRKLLYEFSNYFGVKFWRHA